MVDDVTQPLLGGISAPNLDVHLDDITDHGSHDYSDVREGSSPLSDLPRNVDYTVAPGVNEPSPAGGECLNNGLLQFYTPLWNDIQTLPVFERCMDGSCDCCHLIGDKPAQLKPCRAAQFLFGPNGLPGMTEERRWYLWNGLVNGFKIVDDDCISSYVCENYDSITSEEFKEEMSTLLQTELDCHKVSLATTPPQCVHALGAVKKSDGRLRPITDCSRPDGSSINNYMSSTFESFSYHSVDTAVQLLAPNDFMAVVDIASAYRSVNVFGEHTKFQGFSWDFGHGEQTLTDNRLCFGLRCAPNIFNSLSEFIVDIAWSRGACKVVNYLDDFLIIAGSEEECLAARDVVTSVITLLGFNVSWKKVTSLSQVTTFLGITIDSVNMELSLPQAKVDKLKLCIETLIAKGSASKKELECIGGLVSHCSYVVRGGRTFSRRIFDLSASYSRASKAIPLDGSILADLEWWLKFCDCFNGKACIICDLHPVPMYSDSSFQGFGAWMGRDWLAGCWSQDSLPCDFDFGCSHLESGPSFDSAPRNINVLELWPVILGIRRWGPYFKNCFVHVVTDNMQVLALLCTGRSSNKLCMSWLRELFWMCFIWNIDIKASYIKSADNHLADALSRLPYSGVTPLCVQLLSNLNMCCSSPDRCIPAPAEETTEDPSRCSTSRLY